MLRSSPSSSVSHAISTETVARRFSNRWALRGVSLQVRPGEVVAIRGSNGSGKSTLLRVIATALRPTRGSCSVYGYDVVRAAANVRTLVGLLGHGAALYDDLTVTENLRFAARMMGLPDDAGVIAAAIDAVALGAAAHERAHTLSSGMQRRVALARLRLRAPRVLLLDEPYNSLDAEGVEIVNDLVNATRLVGGAVLLVTHDPERMLQLVDRVATMDDGRLYESGLSGAPPLDLAPQRSRLLARDGTR